MRTLAHISDLHFGTAVPRVAEGLIRELREKPPSLVVVSGDLTQRARRSQFAAAREFLDQLTSPYLVVPGNHDVPFYDVVRRFASPLGRYRHQIQEDLDPMFEDDELSVIGVNTARSLVWKGGKISPNQIEELRQRLGRAGDRFKVVVTHHPFIPSPLSQSSGIDLARAAEVLAVLEEFEVDLLLAGHLHHGYTGDTRAHFASARRSIISVQAGTAISRRVRHEPNAYNWITLELDSISVEVRAWDGTAFKAGKTSQFELRDAAWVPL